MFWTLFFLITSVPHRAHLLFLSFLFYRLGFRHFYRVAVVQSVFVFIRIYVIGRFLSTFHIKVNFNLSAINHHSVHLEKSRLSRLVGFKLDVGEPLWLLGLPVVSQSNSFNLAKSSESVANIVLLKRVGKSLNKKCDTVSRHGLCSLLYLS